MNSLDLALSTNCVDTFASADEHHARESFVGCLLRLAQNRPADVAFSELIDSGALGATITYAQLDRRAQEIAVTLRHMGLRGERVVLAYPPGLEFIAGFFGALYAGCVAVPTSQPRHRTLDRFHALVSDAGAAVAMSTAGDIVIFQAMAGHSKSIRWLATDQIAIQNAGTWERCDPAPDSLAMIQYTSGSTSTPKGVMLSHNNLLANTRAIANAFNVGPGSSSVFWLPTHHDMGLVGGVLVPVLCGAPSTVMAPAMFLQDPYSWLRAISTSRATISGGPNFAFDLCVRKITPEQRSTLDLSCWSLAFIGAETVRPETLDRFAELFAPCGFRPESFYPCYGLAEATLMVTGPRAGAGAAVHAFGEEMLTQNRVVSLRAVGQRDGFQSRRVVGCGEPVGGMRIEIVDPDSLVPVAPGRVGEIWVAGTSVGVGYWNDQPRTETAFAAQLDGTGIGHFLRTGDLGFFHLGQLYLAGRIDDLIIVRGCNHHPQDIEATATLCHPHLASGLGAAFAVQEDGLEHLVLVHEVERGDSSETNSVLATVRAAILDRHGLAFDVLFVRRGTIGRTTSGKVQRRACRAAYLAGQLRPIAELRPKRGPLSSASPTRAVSSAALAVVCQHAIAISGTRLADVSPDSPISALGLDSLQRVELVAALDKRFGGRLPDAACCKASTLGDLAAAVQEHLIDGLKATPGTAIQAEQCDVALFPEYLEFKRHERMLLAVAGSNPYFRADEGTDVHTSGSRGLAHIDGRQLINFGVYDYLGMAHDPTVIAATKAAIDRYGTGAGASRLVSGEKLIHGELEASLAAFLGVPSSLVFVSGHATNVSAIGHLLGPGDLIVHDVLAHNSILQGARLSGATCRGFAHNDWRAATTLLKEIRAGFRRVLIAIEGIYSMDGDMPDLARFVQVKKEHRAMLLVDEAHSLGTLGPTGRGIGESCGVARADVEVWMGTLSKSLASCGGYIAGSKELVEYLKYTAPGFVYSVGLSPPNAGAALAALELLHREPERVSRLAKLSALFLQQARHRGLDTGLAGGTPIVPVIIGNSVKCLLLSAALFRRGINVQPILHPAVPEHATRLRFFITTNHTEAMIRDTVAAVAEELARL